MPPNTTPTPQPNPEQTPLAKPELQPFPAPPEVAPSTPVNQPSAPPFQPTPPPQLPVTPPSPPIVVPPATPPAPAVGPTPSTAGDVDVIEKEWVDQADKIIEQTKGDPYVEEEAEEALQQDYLKKRYGHDVKKPDAT